MIFPKLLQKGDWIGVTALSHPIDDPLDQYRFNHAANQIARAGFGAAFTNNVFQPADKFGRSGSGEDKALEFNALLVEDKVKAIISAAGGDFQMEMLQYIDLDLFKANPKWVQGYSDNTAILYYLATKADIATAYGCNFSDFGMEPWDESVKRSLGVLTGSVKIQESFDMYQDGFKQRVTGLEGYSKDKPVFWRTLDGKNALFQGRLLGGCMDVILNMIGTPYDGTMDFIDRYKKDGIIWYLESFDLGFERMMEGLWKMRSLGFFEGARGILFGRPMYYQTQTFEGRTLPSYAEVLEERLGDLDIPIIMDADIGHKGPQFVMINGAAARVEARDGKGFVIYF